MDHLICAALAMVGVLSFLYSMFARPTGFFLVLFSIPSVMWLMLYVFGELSQTNAASPLMWTGNAQMGELTAVLAAAGFTIFLCGGHPWKTKSTVTTA